MHAADWDDWDDCVNKYPAVEVPNFRIPLSPEDFFQLQRSIVVEDLSLSDMEMCHLEAKQFVMDHSCF